VPPDNFGDIMNKGVLLVVFVIFLIFFGFFISSQIPVVITQDEMFGAIDDAIAETGVQVDETEVQQAVEKSLEILESRQRKRLRYLVAAYFIIWLIFILYALRLAQTQKELQQRIDQLQGVSQGKKL
jgi:CcmD family protein